MSGNNARRDELGDFLKARRAELRPHMVGLPDGDRPRRVPGLRREEVAQLASISTDYYTRLEQGTLPASAHVLAALARALRLDEDQRTYVYGLAGKTAARPRRRTAQRVRPQWQRLLDQLTESPAMVLGRYMDILAWNSLAAALIADFSAIPATQRNYVRLAFLEPAVRNLFDDWETTARTCVAFLRMEAAQSPTDSRLAGLVGELSVQDADFRRWWASHDVASKASGTKLLHHPVAGDLTLDWEMLASTADPDQQLMVMTAAPGTPSHQALSFLTSWTEATHSEAARGDRS
ncbi:MULTISPECIES: helix-turn-helix domain-containing protein [Streptomyces]|uniref:MmyB family transcriptional regulator n=1 Tax=Streptomyces TaxID=1883 RepID=UPI001C2E0B49|nr:MULTISPECIES: helix-turn-helix domain-containing protein [Streptomyces]MBV1949428.1 helix-turn-helix domain-containing protein [Streptomyces sp. BV129]BDH05876.1 transcriptional regulator [Streptomyces seoulensis]